MANTITDNRTLLSANNAADPAPDDLAGAPDTGSDTETFINGTSSRPFKVSATVGGRLYDAGSAQDWTGNTFYLWLKCTSITNTLANGGVRIRFCGATVTDYFEKYVYGGGIGSIAGWEMAVVDITKARADAVGGTLGGIGGTAPAVNAIRYVGVVFDVPGMISGNTDNCFINGFWRLPASTPGIIVQGRNAGTTDWNFNDINTAGDVTDPTKAWGTTLRRNGIITFNTPIQIGFNDTSTHGFTALNRTVSWQNNLVPDVFYGITLVGNVGGTTNFTLGVKTGTGDTATGAQGGTITASENGVRWFFTASDANLNSVNIYGASFQHSGNLNLNNSVIEVITTLLIDCTYALTNNAVFNRNSIIDPNTADGVAFIQTNTIGNIKYCTFNFSDGHAIEDTNTSGTPNNLLGNIFAGAYGGTPGSNLVASSGSTDAMIYNNGGVAKTYNILNGGTVPSIRNGVSATTTVAVSVPVEVTVVDENQIPIEGATVYLLTTTGAVVVLNGETNASGVISGSFGGSTPVNIDSTVSGVKHGSSPIPYEYFTLGGEITSTGYSQTAILSVD